jgi:hypothetical protein
VMLERESFAFRTTIEWQQTMEGRVRMRCDEDHVG